MEALQQLYALAPGAAVVLITGKIILDWVEKRRGGSNGDGGLRREDLTKIVETHSIVKDLKENDLPRMEAGIKSAHDRLNDANEVSRAQGERLARIEGRTNGASRRAS